MRWVVPHIVGKDEVSVALNCRINSKQRVDFMFQGISVSQIEMPQDTTFTWHVSARQAPEVP